MGLLIHVDLHMCRKIIIIDWINRLLFRNYEFCHINTIITYLYSLLILGTFARV